MSRFISVKNCLFTPDSVLMFMTQSRGIHVVLDTLDGRINMNESPVEFLKRFPEGTFVSPLCQGETAFIRPDRISGSEDHTTHLEIFFEKGESFTITPLHGHTTQEIKDVLGLREEGE